MIKKGTCQAISFTKYTLVSEENNFNESAQFQQNSWLFFNAKTSLTAQIKPNQTHD